MDIRIEDSLSKVVARNVKSGKETPVSENCVYLHISVCEC